MHEMTKKFLEDAFAGESMAHMKYMIFCRRCRAKGANKAGKFVESYRLCGVLCMRRIILRH